LTLLWRGSKLIKRNIKNKKNPILRKTLREKVFSFFSYYYFLYIFFIKIKVSWRTHQFKFASCCDPSYNFFFWQCCCCCCYIGSSQLSIL
jgi:hypothetical protein